MKMKVKVKVQIKEEAKWDNLEIQMERSNAN